MDTRCSLSSGRAIIGSANPGMPEREGWVRLPVPRSRLALAVGAIAKMGISETLRELEEKLQTTSVRKNAAAVSSMLTEEFREYGSSGHIFSKTEIICALQSESESPAHFSMKDFQAS